MFITLNQLKKSIAKTLSVTVTEVDKAKTDLNTQLENHINDNNNPHEVTLAQLGLTSSVEELNSLTNHIVDSNIHVSEEEKQIWNNKSNFSGKYTDLTDIPTDLASTTYVDNKVADLVNSAPGTLDTLNELAAALGNDENFATTVTNSLAEKASNDDLNAVLSRIQQLETQQAEMLAKLQQAVFLKEEE